MNEECFLISVLLVLNMSLYRIYIKVKVKYKHAFLYKIEILFVYRLLFSLT